MSAPPRGLPLGATRAQAEEFFRRFKLEKLPLIDGYITDLLPLF